MDMKLYKNEQKYLEYPGLPNVVCLFRRKWILKTMQSLAICALVKILQAEILPRLTPSAITFCSQCKANTHLTKLVEQEFPFLWKHIRLQ